MTADLLDRPIAELAKSLRAGDTSSAELTEAALANHARRGSTLAAYKAVEPDLARRQAVAADAALAAGFDFGPLQGLPVSVKDLYGVRGYPTFAGTPRALPAEWEQEGPVVATLRRGLPVIVGKTHTVEFAFGGLGTNPHWGTPRNPWDGEAHRVPGGSSAGAGVSLWEGSAVLALGSDTAGSVRIPASMTGTCGIKTSAGRWSTSGIVPLSRTLDTAGILARSIADLALAFAVMDPLVDGDADGFMAELGTIELAGLEAGLCDWFFEDCSPGIAEAVRQAIGELERRGLRVRSIELPEIAQASELFRSGGLAAAEFAAFVNTEMADLKPTLDPNVKARFERMEQVTAVDYLARRWRLEKLAASLAERMGGIDVLLAPTVPITPPRLDEVADGESYHRANMAALRNTSPANLLTLSAVTLPAGRDAAGMPAGLQIVAPYGEDERALATGLACEAVLGTARDRLGIPPLCR